MRFRKLDRPFVIVSPAKLIGFRKCMVLMNEYSCSLA